MEVTVGLRVVRGPNWTWGEQDGGNGHVGTVVELHRAQRQGQNAKPCVVTVQWDMGNRCRYRCGVGERYDLRVLDSAPAGICHANVVCDSCGEEVITGTRWKCIRCLDYDLCSSCYGSGRHRLEHEFNRIDAQGLKIRVPARQGFKKVEARGIFTGAMVVAGHDLKSKGKAVAIPTGTGKVLSVQGKDYENSRGFAEVEWSSEKTLCRVGHQGKVDVTCVESASGGYYYPEHLTALGEPLPPPNPHLIAAGDLVRVELDPDVFKAMQKGHGGWNEPMVEIIARIGRVQAVLESGDLRVNYTDSMNSTWTICQEAVVKVDLPQFRIGDLVKVVSSTHEEGHGYKWTSTFLKLLGETGQVLEVFSDGLVMVVIKGVSYLFKPIYLERITVAEPLPSESSESEWVPKKDSDVTLHMTLQSMAEKNDPQVVASAAIASDILVLKDYLDKHPEHVDYKWKDRTALQMTSIGGNTSSMKVLLDYGADTNVEDPNGYKPLHHAVVSGCTQAVEVLLSAGADMNCKNKDGFTPLMTAAFRGSVAVLKILVQHSKVNLHEQDRDGNTALHYAVVSQKVKCVSVLLDAGADPTLLNFRLYTPIHDASRIACLPVIELLLTTFPEHIDIRVIDAGYTPLHLAALVGANDVVSFLIEKGCNINAQTDSKQTALQIALLQGYSSVVESLVLGGVDLNLGDIHGYTPLHALVLLRTTMELPTDETPLLQKIHKLLFGDVSDNDGTVCVCISVIFLLLYKGADIHAKERSGYSPADHFPYLTTLMTLCVDHGHELERPGGPKINGLINAYGHSISLVTHTERSSKHGSMVLGRGRMKSHGHKDESPYPSYRDDYGDENEDLDEGVYAMSYGGRYHYGYGRDSSGSRTVYDSGETGDKGNEERRASKGREEWLYSTASISQSGGEVLSDDQPKSKHSAHLHVMSGVTQSGADDSGNGNLCFLCDNPANVTFTPCGHCSMCKECAPRAKRCPTCKNPVEGFSHNII